MTSWAVRTANALANRGRRVIIAAHESIAANAIGLADIGLAESVTVVRLPLLSDDANWKVNLRSYAQMLPAVLIPTTHEKSFEIAASLAQTLPDQIRILGWNHSDHDYDYACLTHLEPACERIVTNTGTCKRRIDRLIPHRAEHVVQIPHVMDTTSQSRPHWDGPIRIGYAGRLESSAKRVDDLVDVARILRDRGVQFIMRIAGDGPERHRIAGDIKTLQEEFDESARIASNHEHSEIQLLKPQSPNRMDAFWQRCDCLLLPSAYEGLNLQMLEAMANGCVPIVSRVDSGPDDFIRNGINGYTFDIGDCESAADRISDAMQSPSHRLELSRNAQSTIQQRCGTAATVDRLDALIQEVIDSSPRRWPDTRSASMRVEESKQSGDAVLRMRNALNAAARRGEKAVAIYGAGRHTHMIASAFDTSPLEILAFIDDDSASHQASLLGRPVVSRREAIALGIDSVVISSRMNERQILRHRHQFSNAGIRLIPLYPSTESDEGPELQSAPHPTMRPHCNNETTPIAGVAER